MPVAALRLLVDQLLYYFRRTWLPPDDELEHDLPTSPSQDDPGGHEQCGVEAVHAGRL